MEEIKTNFEINQKQEKELYHLKKEIQVLKSYRNNETNGFRRQKSGIKAQKSSQILTSPSKNPSKTVLNLNKKFKSIHKRNKTISSTIESNSIYLPELTPVSKSKPLRRKRNQTPAKVKTEIEYLSKRQSSLAKLKKRVPKSPDRASKATRNMSFEKPRMRT